VLGWKGAAMGRAQFWAEFVGKMCRETFLDEAGDVACKKVAISEAPPRHNPGSQCLHSPLMDARPRW